MNERNFIPMLFKLIIIFVMVISFTACVAAIPVVVIYKSKSQYIATVEVEIEADKVFHAAVNESEARPQIEILEKNDSDLLLKITDGTQTASIKAISTDEDKTNLIVTADIPGFEQEKEEELALRIVKVICDSLGVEYQLIKG